MSHLFTRNSLFFSVAVDEKSFAVFFFFRLFHFAHASKGGVSLEQEIIHGVSSESRV
eukprot:m.76360 g.76360  ORF g.76360 m.76360 type:complete len:57 (-) comp14022_c2_seq2:1959-2129(-)